MTCCLLHENAMYIWSSIVESVRRRGLRNVVDADCLNMHMKGMRALVNECSALFHGSRFLVHEQSNLSALGAS